MWLCRKQPLKDITDLQDRTMANTNTHVEPAETRPSLLESLDTLLGLTSKEFPTAHRKKLYKQGHVLGHGSYGVVRQVVHIQTGKTYALKSIEKKTLKSPQAVEMVHREMSILTDIHHPNIINMFDAFETKGKFYMVLELATGGELFERLALRGKFTEKDAANIIYPVLDAIGFLHDHGIVHRDIKPENCLYKDKSENSEIVLADFGVSNFINNENELLTSLAGSPGYAAPEVLRRTGHNKPADIWSVGCLAYTILCGFHPFYYCEDMGELIESTSNGRWKFDSPYWDHISSTAKDFIKACLNLKPSDRPTAAQAKLHPWLVKYNHSAKENARKYLTSIKRPSRPLPSAPILIANPQKSEVSQLTPAQSSEDLPDVAILQDIEFVSEDTKLPNLAEEVWAANPSTDDAAVSTELVAEPDTVDSIVSSLASVKIDSSDTLANATSPQDIDSRPKAKKRPTLKSAVQVVTAANRMANFRNGLLVLGRKAAIRRQQLENQLHPSDDHDGGLSSGSEEHL
ncbi:hypothetical protein HK096_004609 [Nowakowskiella sp. JEL0078]|nr:hypothetical protein HK096_004609 [Nowakowskiella sp. JEL0078]